MRRVVTSYRLMDGASGRPGVGSSGTQPPASTTGISGNYVAGTAFKVTTQCWLEGYWWYVCASGSQTVTAQKFALWSANRDGSNSQRGSVIAAATVTSGALSPGWNYVPLATPVPLTVGWTYIGSTGYNPAGNGIPYTNAQWGSGDPYSAGIVNGPLTAFSDLSGSNPDPWGWPQGSYISGATADPTVSLPSSNSGSFNGWLDIQVTTVAPANSTYRLFPSIEGWQGGTAPDYNTNSTDTAGYTVGNTFVLRQAAKPLKLWFLSESHATILPSRCAVWDVQTQTVVSGTDNSSPAWKAESGGSGVAGAGWVYCDYSASGVVLPSGRNMIAAVWSAGGSVWRGYSVPFWGTGGLNTTPAINASAGGLDYNVIYAPSTAGGTPLQGGYSGPGLAWAFPGSWNNPENDWTDIEVTPAAASSGLLMAGII